MTYPINAPIPDSFVLRDNSNVAITGKGVADFATVEAYLLSDDTITATVAISEIGEGEYTTSFTPSVVGTWTLHLVYDVGGVFREFTQTYVAISVTATSTETYVIGNTIRDTIIIRDNGDVAIPGLTSANFATIEAYALPLGTTTAGVILAEIGAGEYALSFAPTIAGVWTLHVVYNQDGVFRELSGTYTVAAVAAPSTDVAATGASSFSRQSLRRRIADRLGDLVILDATSASLSNTTFVDALNISGAADNLTGRQFVVTNGTNQGHVGRITSSTEATNTITFVPPATGAFSVGDQLEVVNERSRGWSIAEYNRAINNAINDAYPIGVAEFAATITGDFSLDSPFITIPDAMNEVYAVSWQDTSNETWVPLRGGQFYGWTVDATAGTISVVGGPSRLAEGMVMRVLGYGRHPELSADTDTTTLNAEWLVARACYHLAVSGADRDAARANTILLYQRESEQFRVRIRTLRKPGTTRVRP